MEAHVIGVVLYRATKAVAIAIPAAGQIIRRRVTETIRCNGTVAAIHQFHESSINDHGIQNQGILEVRIVKGDLYRIANKVNAIFDMRPYAIEKRLKLRTPIYSETAAYGHMGRESEIKTVRMVSGPGEVKMMEVETFTREKLDYVDQVKVAFGL